MKRNSCKMGWNQWVLLTCLFVLPLSSVYAACCAGHGGVVRCDKTLGQQVCKDGTVSPTCTCTKSKKTQKKAETKLKTTKKAAETAVPAGVSTTPKKTAPKSTAPKKSTWWGSSNSETVNKANGATTTKKVPAKTTNKGWFGNQSGNSQSAKGCCSNHGGVAQCNRKTGFQACKDGSTSPTCRCQ